MPALADGWSAHVDPTTQRTYYFNATTNETTWTMPAAPVPAPAPRPLPAHDEAEDSRSATPTRNPAPVLVGAKKPAPQLQMPMTAAGVPRRNLPGLPLGMLTPHDGPAEQASNAMGVLDKQPDVCIDNKPASVRSRLAQKLNLDTEEGRYRVKSRAWEGKLLGSGIMPLVDLAFDIAVLVSLYSDAEESAQRPGGCEAQNTVTGCGYTWFVISLVIFTLHGFMQMMFVHTYHTDTRNYKVGQNHPDYGKPNERHNYTTAQYGSPDSAIRRTIAYFLAFLGLQSFVYSLNFVFLHRQGEELTEKGRDLASQGESMVERGEKERGQLAVTRGTNMMTRGAELLEIADAQEELKGCKFVEVLFEAIPQSILQAYVGLASGRLKRDVTVVVAGTMPTGAKPFSWLFALSVTVTCASAAYTFVQEEEVARNFAFERHGVDFVAKEVREKEERENVPYADREKQFKIFSMLGIAMIVFRFCEIYTLVLTLALMLCAFRGLVLFGFVAEVMLMLFYVFKTKYPEQDGWNNFKVDLGRWTIHCAFSTLFYYTDVAKNCGLSCLHSGMVADNGKVYFFFRTVERLVLASIFLLLGNVTTLAQQRNCGKNTLVLWITFFSFVLLNVAGLVVWHKDPVKHFNLCDDTKHGNIANRRPRVMRFFKILTGDNSNDDQLTADIDGHHDPHDPLALHGI